MIVTDNMNVINLNILIANFIYNFIQIAINMLMNIKNNNAINIHIMAIITMILLLQ